MARNFLKNHVHDFSPGQWQILRTASIAACLCQLVIIWRSREQGISVYDILLFGCYVIAFGAFLIGGRWQIKHGYYRRRAIHLKKSQARIFRALILGSLLVFLFGAYLDPRLFGSSGMISVLFLATVLWTMTMEWSPQELADMAGVEPTPKVTPGMEANTEETATTTTTETATSAPHGG